MSYSKALAEAKAKIDFTSKVLEAVDRRLSDKIRKGEILIPKK